MTARLALAVAILLLATLFAMTRTAPTRSHHERLFLFGSFAEIEVHGAASDRLATAMAELSRTWSTFHRDWHPWQEGALVALNRSLASGEWATPPASLLELIALGRRYEIDSGGLLNPAIGGLVDLWGFHTSDFPVRGPAPGQEAVADLLQTQPSMRQLQVEGDRVRSDNPRVQLDFSAIAEGRALAEGASILRAHDIEHALLTLGGDILALGHKDGTPWRVAIRHPAGGVLAGIALADGEALFSSGGYSRFREDADGRWPHLIDPRDGQPARVALASTAVHRDPVRADAAATALMIGGPEAFERLVADMAIACALVLDHAATLHVTEALLARIELLDDAIRVRRVAGPPDCDG
jgi:FAD:protein FMN transferase